MRHHITNTRASSMSAGEELDRMCWEWMHGGCELEKAAALMDIYGRSFQSMPVPPRFSAKGNASMLLLRRLGEARVYFYIEFCDRILGEERFYFIAEGLPCDIGFVRVYASTPELSIARGVGSLFEMGMTLDVLRGKGRATPWDEDETEFTVTLKGEQRKLYTSGADDE